MTQIPLLSGMGATESADIEHVYPRNLEAVSIESGISTGQFRSAMGASFYTEGPGADRGSVLWNNTHLRVMGTKLVSVQREAITVLGDVGSDGAVAFASGIDRVAIRSGTNMFYWNGSTLVQVTDPDLGPCIDIAWFKGQFFSTDGNYIVALELADPTQVNPLKYGAADSSPDKITGLQVIRNELAATGSNTIEFFSYTGGSGFPLTVNDGATIPYGCVGASAKGRFSETFAFVGGGENQAVGAYVAGSGSAEKISTRGIDAMLATELNPAAIQIEVRKSLNEERLYIHLTNLTLVYLPSASAAAGIRVWYYANSGQMYEKPYRLRNALLVNGDWICGDTESAALGKLSETLASHFGETIGWGFQTQFLYNQAKGAIIHDIELVGLWGRATNVSSTAWWSYSLDGETWSMERGAILPKRGARTNRVAWRPHKRFSSYMTLRFRGDSDSLVGIAALEAPNIEPLTT